MTILVTVTALVGSVFFSASPAAARNINIFETSFGAATSTPANPYPLSEPSAVAVDATTHDVYVTDEGNHRVEKFDSSGHLILMFGEGVDQTTGENVCTVSSGDTCQSGASESSPGALSAPAFIAVDNSTGPSAGDVYVGDTATQDVTKFNASGELIESWGVNGQLTGFNPLYGIAVDPSGNLFVLDEVTNWYEQDGTLHKPPFGYPRGTEPVGLAVDAEDHLYKADGFPEVTKFTTTGEGLGEPDGTGSATGLAVDPTSNDLFVVEGGSSVSHFGLNCGQHCSPEDTFGSGHLSGARNLAIDGNSHSVLVANTGENDVAVFSAVLLPEPTTEAATEVGQTDATLTGTADPAGGANITSCYFEYGTDTSYGLGTVPCTPAVPYSSSTAVSASLTGLDTEVRYHYRLVAVSEKGTSVGADRTFTTHAVPEISTDPPGQITAVSATLNGSWVGNGEDTHYFFEYGPTTSYGSTTAALPGTDGGSPTGPHSVSFQLNGLSFFTTYHYRLVASDAVGTSYGEDVAFSTLGAHRFETVIGSTGTGDGQFKSPAAIAVNEGSGAIYVADTGNHRVVKLNAAGSFVAAWGWGVSDGSAVDEVCTSGCQAGVSGGGLGQFSKPEFIAVDNSAGPSAGDVYVADTAHDTVQKFDPSGNLVQSWGTNGSTTYDSEIGGIAVAANGALVVQPGGGNGIAIDSLGKVFSGAIAIDRTTDARYYNNGTEILEVNSSQGCDPTYPYAPCPPVDSFGSGQLNSARGIADNATTGDIYAANTGDDDIVVFEALPLPEVTTAPVTTLGPDSATLTGHVDPGAGGNVMDCRFEYGTNMSYSLGSVPCSPATPYSSPINVSADLTGLTPFTAYHFRLVATGANSQGFDATSRDRTFTPTPGLVPSVGTASVGTVTPTSATVTAQVSPNLSPTTFRIDYGTDLSYGSHTLSSESIGSGATAQAVTETISELSPATTYHFRVVAVNFNGSTSGPDGTFTTPDVPSVAESGVSAIGQTTATLIAALRPGFRPTTYHFEYGLTADYSASTAESSPIGSDNSAHSVSGTLAGLAPGTTYHYRVVASNAIGATDGPDHTLTTEESSVGTEEPAPVPCKRGFVMRHGRCVKKQHKGSGRHHKAKHHRQGRRDA